jgi:hypothetical protein
MIQTSLKKMSNNISIIREIIYQYGLDNLNDILTELIALGIWNASDND